MAIEHDIQRAILLKLIHNPSLGFNELWDKQGESNAFAYHVHKLETSGHISKGDDGKYALTAQGRKLSAFIEGDTGGHAAFPTLTVVMLVWDGEKLLCQKRLKEPYYGLWGNVSGKINFGMNLFECATRDLFEETSLVVAEDTWKFVALEQAKTFEEGKIAFHHYLLVVESRSYTGTLKERTHKAEHAWLTPAEYKALPGFPKDVLFDHVIPANRPFLIEHERFLQEGKFVGSTVTRKVEL